MGSSIPDLTTPLSKDRAICQAHLVFMLAMFVSFVQLCKSTQASFIKRLPFMFYACDKTQTRRVIQTLTDYFVRYMWMQISNQPIIGQQFNLFRHVGWDDMLKSKPSIWMGKKGDLRDFEHGMIHQDFPTSPSVGFAWNSLGKWENIQWVVWVKIPCSGQRS